MITTSSTRYHLEGELFEAHVCSKGCTCDPCNCNPCNCASGRADDFPTGPLWKITGYQISAGQLQGVAVAELTLIKLALTSGTGTNDDWQEYLLLPQGASDAQVAVLMEGLRTGAFPVLASSTGEPLPLYLVPLEYCKKDDQRAHLQVDFTYAASAQISGNPVVARPDWTYQRHVALQEYFESRK